MRDFLPVNCQREGLADAHVIEGSLVPVGSQCREAELRSLLNYRIFQTSGSLKRCGGWIADIAVTLEECVPGRVGRIDAWRFVQGVLDTAQQWLLAPESLVACEL